MEKFIAIGIAVFFIAIILAIEFAVLSVLGVQQAAVIILPFTAGIGVRKIKKYF